MEQRADLLEILDSIHPADLDYQECRICDAELGKDRRKGYPVASVPWKLGSNSWSAGPGTE